MRVFNQFTESFSVLELAQLVQKAGAEVGLDVAVEPIDNPRFELEEHYYNPVHTKLLDLGLKPHLLSETLIGSVFTEIGRHRDRVIADHILPRDRWRSGSRPRRLRPRSAMWAPAAARRGGRGRVLPRRRALLPAPQHQPAEPVHGVPRDDRGRRARCSVPGPVRPRLRHLQLPAPATTGDSSACCSAPWSCSSCCCSACRGTPIAASGRSDCSWRRSPSSGSTGRRPTGACRPAPR